MSPRNDDVCSTLTLCYSSCSWLRGKFIGRGCFGTVDLAVNTSDGRIFAVKSVDIATCLPCQLQSLENEIRILRSLSSSASSPPHVVRFLGDDVTREGTTTFRNLHLEYMPRGSLADVAGDDLDEQLVRRFTRCLVSALSHAHTRGFVHCDVKASNVLLGDEPGSVKLADFGSGTEIEPGSSAPMLPRGSPMWMAPEVIRREYQGPESDVWSLGCTVIEMVTGKPPWRDSGAEALRIIGFSDELPSFPTRLSELGRDFLGKCLRRDPSERWNCDQLLQHPFLAVICDSESSPRRVLDWVDSVFEEDEEEAGESEWDSKFEISVSARGRIGKLARSIGVNWESYGWLAVRDSNDEEGETRRESCGSSDSEMAGPRRAEMELYICSSQWQNCKYVEGKQNCGCGSANLAELAIVFVYFMWISNVHMRFLFVWFIFNHKTCF